jgi:hypothetical protein
VIEAQQKVDTDHSTWNVGMRSEGRNRVTNITAGSSLSTYPVVNTFEAYVNLEKEEISLGSLENPLGNARGEYLLTTIHLQRFFHPRYIGIVDISLVKVLAEVTQTTIT